MVDQKNYQEKRQITMGILAHVDAGKTTLSEALMYLTGSIRRLGRVDHRDAFLDTFSLEREISQSIRETLTSISVLRHLRLSFVSHS